MGRDVYICGAVRSPVGKGTRKGSLHNFHPVNLLALILDGLAKKSLLDKSQVEDICVGCVTQVKSQGANIGRIASLKAGFPPHVPAFTINRMCGSGQTAIHIIASKIAAGDIDCGIAGGVELMSVEKMGSDSDILVNPSKEFRESFPYRLMHQGVSADLIAKKYGITREECDDIAARSHELCFKATQNGVFGSQIIPIHVKNPDGTFRIFTRDEGIRYPVNQRKLRSLKPYFSKDGVVTAGNASQISDGAAALLLCSKEKADELGLPKLAKFVVRVVVGDDPELMLTAPIPATRLALKKSGLSIDDMDCIEINEAFAVVVAAWRKKIKPPFERVNPNGGACAHGHPLGATGAILMTKLVHELQRTGGKYGLQTICIAHGLGNATIIENCSGSEDDSYSPSAIYRRGLSGFTATTTSTSNSSSKKTARL